MADRIIKDNLDWATSLMNLEGGALGGGMTASGGAGAGLGAILSVIFNSSANELKKNGIKELLTKAQMEAAKNNAQGSTLNETKVPSLPPIENSEWVPNVPPTTNPSLPVSLGQLQIPNVGGNTSTAGQLPMPGLAIPGNKENTTGLNPEKERAIKNKFIGNVQTNVEETTADSLGGEVKTDEQGGQEGEPVTPIVVPEDEYVSGINGVDLDEWKTWYEETRQAAWDREDQIRKETQEREDTAYQRSVADMLKAGINPNLMNVQPAASGGGITTATSGDVSQLQAALTHTGDLIEQMIAQAFQSDENAKDRFNKLLGNLIGGLANMILLKV